VRLYTDAMLGTLTTHLRFCGHDTVFALEEGIEADDAIRERVVESGRTLLTRDEGLAARVDGAVLLTSRTLDDQLAACGVAGIDLTVPDEPTRCGRCNGELAAVGAGEATPEYAPEAGERRQWRCVDCGQHFWKGSHWAAMADRLAAVRNADVPADGSPG
jgi:hypothetical protein